MKFQAPVKPKKQLTSSLQIIPSGPAGVYHTLRIMRDLTRHGKRDIVIRQKALELTGSLNQKDWLGEVKSLHRFVRDNIRYIKDIRGVETVAYPDITLECAQGDCDDKSVLLASLLESIGHPTRFVAVGFRPENYSHVYVETRMSDKWIGLETTEPVNVGWQPKGVMARMVVSN